MKKKLSGYLLIAATVALSLHAAGCGQTPINEQGGTTPPPVVDGGGGGTIIPANTPPSYEFHYKMQGSGYAYQVGGGSMKVSTDTQLIVAITAGEGLPLDNTGFTIGFNCQKFSVKVGNITKLAFVRKENYPGAGSTWDPCYGAVTTWAYDFSGALSTGSNQDVSIKVFNAQYDNCRLAYNPYVGGCAMSGVHSSHQVDGFMSVYTN